LRIHSASLVALATIAACASAPKGGPLAEGMGGASRIVAVDSTRPPSAVTVELDQPAHVALLLVIPGHSATLLYPRDSATDNRRPAGQSTIAFEVPGLLVRRDSSAMRQRDARIRAQDSTIRRRRTVGGSATNSPGPIPVNAVPYMLLVTSPQPLVYQRIIERTAGVSIPSVDVEALNAVAKAVRATIPEPRSISGFYEPVPIAGDR
jgi:hypothetical protein